MLFLTFSSSIFQTFFGRSVSAPVDLNVGVNLRTSFYLILDHCSTKSPDGSKHKIKLIGILGAVCRDVLRDGIGLMP